MSQSWFHKWRHGDPSAQHARREQLKVATRRLYAMHRGTYGSPRITVDLRAEGWRVSQNTVAALMRELGLAAQRRRRRRQPTPSRSGPVAGTGPDRAGVRHRPAQPQWYGDGTEIPIDQGKLFLDSVLDMGSRRIVGFAVGEHHDATLPPRCRWRSRSAAARTTSAASRCIPPRAACGRVGITQPTGRAGSALDNAVIESWHSTLEFELRDDEHFATKAQARVRVASWIEEYNHRRHSSLGMLSPVAYELRLAQNGSEREPAA